MTVGSLLGSENPMPQYIVMGIGVVLAAFFARVAAVMVASPRMFLKRHGRLHRVFGVLYFAWMVLGFMDAFFALTINRTVYDSILGILGTLLALTAAFEFQHKGVNNVASGTLDQHATVSFNEMIEHAFYQALNLVQILFLHTLTPALDLPCRTLLLFLATSPWLARDYFPVHPFSDNYVKIDPNSTPFIRLLYRLKKYQYIFYKHFLLHGLNLTVALMGVALPEEQFFRLYWMSLNASYVMEFFLQTLVKKRYMQQSTMLWLQKILMLEATVVSLYVLRHVNPFVSLASLFLNFVHRKHDVANTIIIFLIAMVVIYNH